MLLNPKFIDEMRRRTQDPMLDVYFNPRISRWVVVQDLSRGQRPDVWRTTSQDLIGVPGVNPLKTQLVRLFRLEDKGMPVVPNVDWIVREYHIRSRDSRDDNAFNDVMAQETREEADKSQRMRQRLEEDGQYAWALLRKRAWSYAGQTNRSGR